MGKKDDRRSGGGGSTRIPIRFFSRKNAEETEEGSEGPRTTSLNPLRVEGDPPPPAETESAEELERAIEESCRQLERRPRGEDLPVEVRAEALERENEALQDRVLRVAAEFDNYRKRMERDRKMELDRARGKLVGAILPIVDNFQRALETAHNDRAPSRLTTGLELIGRQLDDLLSSFDVRPIQTVGHLFDPSIHEAIAASSQEELPENTIIEEYQRGYMVGDELLRPARVKVVTR